MTTTIERAENKLNWHTGVEWSFLNHDDAEAVEQWHETHERLERNLENAIAFTALSDEWGQWNEIGREFAEAGEMETARLVAETMREIEVAMCNVSEVS